MNKLYIVPFVIMLSACSSENQISTVDSVEQSSSSQDNVHVDQRLSTNSEYIKIANVNKMSMDKSHSEPLQSFTATELTQMYDNELYEFYNYDVNADSIKDKIITHQNDEKNFHQGSDLYVYLGSKNNHYKLSLKSDNFTDETGWFLNGIIPRNNRLGFILTNFYSPRGHSEQSFYFGQQDDEWILRKYVSEGTLISGEEYYCVENQISSLSNRSYGKSREYSESEFVKYCPPLATSYQVTVNKAEILDQNFDPQVPSNYYIKDDVIKVFSQNEDWVEVSYKNNTKRGWVDKRSLQALQ